MSAAGGPLVETALDRVSIRGAVRIERTARGLLPRRMTAASWRRITDPFMRASVGQSAGIRLAFGTAASVMELSVSGMKLTEVESGELPAAAYELCSGGQVVATAWSSVGPRMLFSFERPIGGIVDGPDDTLRFEHLGGRFREYELWLPYSDEVELLGIRADAPIQPPQPRDALRWVHHGSSISHGYVASTTCRTWPVLVANRLALDLTSVAYSGNALLDQSTARTIRDTPADLITLKLGINVVNGDMMRRRIFVSAVHGFLDTVRDGHPDTPIVLASPIHCAPVEHVPGPTMAQPGRDPVWVVSEGRADELRDGKLSLGAIREELASIVDQRSREDAQLRYLDGLALYDEDDNAAVPLPDNLHPDDAVNALIAQRFATLVFGAA